MKKALFNRFILVLFVVCLYLSGCGNETVPLTSSEISDPAATYQAALAALEEKNTYTADMLHSRSIQIGKQTFRDSKRQQLLFSHMSADNPQITIRQDLFYSDQSISSQLLYADNAAYMELAGTTFSQETTFSDFYKEHVGVVYPEANWFSSIHGVVHNEFTVVTFREPTENHSWYLPENSQFLDASSIATLDSDGNLVFLSNLIQYTCNENVVSELYAISYYDLDSVPSFSDISSAINVTSLEYPLLLEQSSGYLQQANHVVGESVKELSSQVTGIHLTEHVKTTKSSHGEALDATVDTLVTVKDPTKGSEVSQQAQAEQFKNGHYLVSANGGESKENTDVTTDAFENYCNNLLLESILLPQYIKNVTIQQDEKSVKIYFQADAQLAQIMASEACQLLYKDPDLVTELIQNCSCEEISAYLTIDMTTNLPIASGLQFKGVHVLDNANYTITSQIDQLYDFS